MIVEKSAVNTWIVDDDNIYAYGFEKLVNIKGLNAIVSHFRNGSEALWHLKNTAKAHNLPDVIFLDINMPVMDGWEFMQQFEEIKFRMGKNITIYMISSSIDLNDIYRAKNISEITDYIFKPVKEQHLAEIFAAVQDKAAEKIFKYGA